MELLAIPLLIMLGLSQVLSTVAETDEDDDNGRDLELGPGDDVRRLGSGDDLVRAYGGADQITGGPGDDRILLGAGDDQNYIDNSDNDLRASGAFDGNDIIRGGAGHDDILDYRGANTLAGGQGDDRIDAVDQSGQIATPDILEGGAGDDTLFADAGDRLTGGEGQDRFGIVIDATPDTPAVITDYAAGEALFVSVPLAFAETDATLIRNGDDLELQLGGSVLLILEGVDDPDSVDLTISASDLADQTINGKDIALGSNGDDTLTTGQGDDAVFAGRGDDVIATGGGDDYVSLRTARPFEVPGDLGWGANTVEAGAGRDQVHGGFGDDVIFGGGGTDLLIGGGGADNIFGGNGNDRIDVSDTGGDASDTVAAGRGDDIISVNDGDIVTSGKGADTIRIDALTNGDQIVTVTDFDPARDSLEVAVTKGKLALSYESHDMGTRVLVDGKAVFDLSGITPQDMRGADVRLTRAL